MDRTPVGFPRQPGIYTPDESGVSKQLAAEEASRCAVLGTAKPKIPPLVPQKA